MQKNLTETYGALSEVCGQFTVDHSTVSRWADRFCGGCVSIDNDPRPGRPRTSTDERHVKLVADALEEDHRATCEELSRAKGAKTLQENAQEPTSSCSWLGHSFSITMLARTSLMLQPKKFAIMSEKCYLMRPAVHT